MLTNLLTCVIVKLFAIELKQKNWVQSSSGGMRVLLNRSGMGTGWLMLALSISCIYIFGMDLPQMSQNLIGSRLAHFVNDLNRLKPGWLMLGCFINQVFLSGFLLSLHE